MPAAFNVPESAYALAHDNQPFAEVQVENVHTPWEPVIEEQISTLHTGEEGADHLMAELETEAQNSESTENGIHVRDLNDCSETDRDALLRHVQSWLETAFHLSEECRREALQQVSLLKGNILVNDDALRILYRTSWEAYLQGPGVNDSSKSLDVETIRRLGALLTDINFHTHLEPLLVDAPVAFDNLSRFVRTHMEHKMLLGHVLDCIPRSFFFNWISSVSVGLLRDEKDPNLPSMTSARRLIRWLRLLRTLDSKKNTFISGDTQLLALGCENIVLRGIRPASFWHADAASEMIAHMLLQWAVHHESTMGVPKLEKEEFVQDFRAFDKHYTLSKFLHKMSQQSIPNHGVAELALEYVYATKGSGAVITTLQQLRALGGTFSHFTFLHPLLSRLLQDGLNSDRQPKHSRHTYALHLCQLLKDLAANSQTNTIDGSDAVIASFESRVLFQHIVHQANDANILPLSYRNTSLDSLMETPTAFIHQLAHQYSIDRTRSRIENWRAIYNLYNYLQRHKLPVRELFTRAVVRIGLTQPMLDNHFVSSQRLEWICLLVARVEGRDVAKRIASTFRVWRGDQILKAKKRLIENGGYGEAHVNTMKKLKQLDR